MTTTGDILRQETPAAPIRERSVALVGRPNVGKSALFNRIARQRVAIVFHEAGVTRDRLERDVVAGGAKFRLVDTGGIFAVDGEKLSGDIDVGVRAQALAAAQRSAVAVLVVDVQAGLNPLDLEVARLLRKSGACTIIAANKADNESLALHAAEFEKLGFPVFPVSALHGRGIASLVEECVRRLPPETAQAGVESAENANGGERPVTVAIVGRPNGGKSSLLNRILRAERSIVSDIPGTTRDSIDEPFEWKGRSFTLIDTAGVRREARVDTAVERYSRYRMQDAVERSELLLLVLDSERGVGLLDRQLAGLAAKLGKSCVIAVNKWDLARESERDFLARLAADLPFMAHCPAVFVSAKTGAGVSRLLSTVSHVAEASRRTIGTGPLNRVLQSACSTSAAPARGGKPFKLHYATQTGISPVRIRLFVNDPRRMPSSFEQFLVNSLRKEFDLSGVGIVLQFRARERKNPDGSAKAPPEPTDLKSRRAARKAGGKSRVRRRAMPRG